MQTRRGEEGFSLIETIIVVSLIAFVYTVALPQLSLKTGTEVANKLNQLASDVRNAYDFAVLSKKTYRMVFVLNSGDYWLEEADRPDVILGNERIGHDATEDEEKEEMVAFDTKFEEFKELAGAEVQDPEKDGKPIMPTSPVLSAKNSLRKARWTRVDTLEWSERTLGTNLLIKDMQAEHHGQKQELAELGEKGRAMIYFFPAGYVQRAYLHVFYKKDELVPDESQQPYTVITKPFEGTADVIPGYQEVDVHDDRDDKT